MSFAQEVDRRRSFAIISHPDAGKTTITEKILYLGGVIREAGEVKGKKGTKAATSDWMKMEQERGVSITSSVMQFDYRGLRVNLLDTPGHKDFGEDTYRVLVVADCAAMLIDAAKGVEAQTRKLYEVCRMRKLPIFTFANKMDRVGKSPLELIDDVENTLKMRCYPVTWPLGMGDRFRGLYHRLNKKLYLFTRGEEQAKVIDVTGPEDPAIREAAIDDDIYHQFCEEMDLMGGVLGDFDREAFLRGELSPMTFGSAKFVWGIDLFLDLFAEHAPAPQPRESTAGVVDPHSEKFSAFVFKIQANMDPKHRDRVSFLRVCSGKFERGMKVTLARTERELRLSYANQFLAQERETVESAYPGDILGVTDNGVFQIGDTVTDGKIFHFHGIPRFSPEHFGRVSTTNALKKKQLEKGVRQLVDEGTIQLFYDPKVGMQDPILGVVGELQFDVMLYRLRDEYGLDVRLERLSFGLARWPRKDGKPAETVVGVDRVYRDLNEQPVIFLERDFQLRWVQEKNPDLEFAITGSLF